MKRPLYVTLGILVLSLMAALPSLLEAGAYNAPSITAIVATSAGDMYIRYAGLPNPGPCPGNNFQWAKIASTANPALKSLAESLYNNRRPIRVVTSGCSGPYELVSMLYSPGG
jgi:hypothetical protein